ncbi:MULTISPECIES: hypothetical protein [unclassified Francisella]|uniref:hypothetical protein n=1 Tax=unclassified Francisella TaxID=2610885 RepID=UPI002E31AB0B|nr:MULTISPECIES: hypothetical protein [unclassified Francisella]MED7818910.1 hypothetical protein [Francisella sp. 19S2-4]MED7829747.1 hypothetical protein [Francisella sp. 19S2-10]
MTTDFEKNENTNKNLLKKLCFEASKHVNYKFLGGGTKVTIDTENYTVPHNISTIINNMLKDNNIKRASTEFKTELYRQFTYNIRPGYSINRSDWTSKLYSNPIRTIDEIKTLYLSDSFTGNFTFSRDERVFYADLNRSWSIKVIKNSEIILNSEEIKSNGNNFEEDILNAVNNLISKRIISDDEINTIYGVNHDLMFDILNTYKNKQYNNTSLTPDYRSINRLKCFLFFEGPMKSSSVDVVLNLDNKLMAINISTQKIFDFNTKEALETLALPNNNNNKTLKMVFGNDYEATLSNSLNFNIQANITFNLNDSKFTCIASLY